MAESPSEVRNLFNEEMSSEDFSFLEALPWQKKVEDSDPDDGVFVLQVDLKKCSNTCEAPVLSRRPLYQGTTPRPEKRYLQYTLPSPSQYKPLIRRHVRQEEIAFDRECKKLEIIWTNRGLPVDKESLCSAASKDAFDLSDLSKSLPSTSASEKINSFVEFRRITRQQQRLRSYYRQTRQYGERFETMHEVRPCTPREERLYTSYRLPTSETTLSIYHSLKERVRKEVEFRGSPSYLRRLVRYKGACSGVPPSELETEPASDEQKETSGARENPEVEKALQHRTCLGSKSAEVPPDDKQEEKRKERQNSDAENNRKSVWSPWPKLLQIEDQGSSWDSERNWITDFQFPDIRVPLNSPVKREENADKSDRFLSMGKVLADIRQSSIKLMRAQSKLRTLNSFRGVLSEDMDESERENPSPEKASKATVQNLRNSKKEAEDLCFSNAKKCRQMIINLQESVKSFRSFQNYFPLGSVKSDKVVAD